MKREPITMERTFDATLHEVWELWTTKAGIESWWGPDGSMWKSTPSISDRAGCCSTR